MLVAVEDRLLELKAAGTLRLVSGAVEFAALENGAIATASMPAAYVLPLGLVSQASRPVNYVRQMATARLAVVLALSNLRDPRGFTASKALQGVYEAVRAKLLGWSPDDEHGPFTHVRAAAVSFQHGVVWWQEEFATDTLIQESA